eukprot:TRINITY_DN2561_c0_g1_i1.p2 TRINITY_DN2561_c0_g1~~TRINITY_DN2561_c0_g1_i1.p2  ORF type:complete len:59 (-),score=5.33 TRINITY_DN2561_c0_g1_i1:275-451(-)
MRHTFGDNAYASCGPGAEYDPLGPGHCLVGDGSPTPLLTVDESYDPDPQGWFMYKTFR